MPEIHIEKGTKITPEVRAAIDKKLKELEQQAHKEGTHIKISDAPSAWSVNYTT